MKLSRIGAGLLVFGCVMTWTIFRSPHVSAAPDEQNAIAAADQLILSEIAEHSAAMADLEYLSDEIGPRLTGSSQLKQANEWTAEMFRKYGLTNVHLESWIAEHAWTRGTASARALTPAEHTLTIASAGWGPSTPGTMRGPLVYFDAKNETDFSRFHGKLNGAIVIYTEPRALPPLLQQNPYTEVVKPMQAPPPGPGDPLVEDTRAMTRQQNRERLEFFKQEGVAGILIDSGKPHGLLNMSTLTGGYAIIPVPAAYVTGEGYRMLFRMLQHGPVQVEMEISNTISDKPVKVYNTVAEIRGSEKPDEVVILGAHLDSWDLGTGATDNGTGSIATLEAARALAKLDLHPKRTIRFILFAGEEQGLRGSLAYVDAHKSELAKMSGILVDDTGAGRVLTIGLHDNYQDREITDQLLAPLHELKLLEPSMERQMGTDHLSFDKAGVPGFWTIQDPGEYNLMHHSQSDTFDKVHKDDFNQAAQVLAAWAYNVAELRELLPRHSTENVITANAEPAVTKATEEMDTKILQQIKADEPRLKADISYLADHIGPRITGSAELDQASHWTEEQFKAAGLTNVKLEPWMIASSWTRGPATGHIVSIDGHPVTPSEQTLTVAALAWSPGTKGPVHGQVIPLEYDKPEDLGKYTGELADAIVLLGQPVEMVSPGNPLTTPWDEDIVPVAHPKGQRPYDPAVFAAMRETRRAVAKFLSEEKIGVVVRASEKEYGLMYTTTVAGSAEKGRVPTTTMARENYERLWRLATAGRVEAEINLEGTFSDKPVQVYNTVAEIRGTEKPDEMVIIGGHLDAWDLGTGATDNGTGAMAVLEAARALQKLNVKPKRTIRFILFTGEEQTELGSKEYVKAHKSELDKSSAVLVDDMGTGKVLTIALMGDYGAQEMMDRALYPLAKAKEIGLAESSLRIVGGSDQFPFSDEGVPGFICLQDQLDYVLTHHSQADTLERVRVDDLTEGAQVLAVFAYNVAQLPEMLPRKSAQPSATAH